MNKLTKKIILFLNVFSVIFLFLGMHSNHQVEAAAYGRGAKFTIPKAYRGTWYSYDSGLDRTVKMTTHTFNGQTVYKISSMKARNKASYYAQTHNGKKKNKVINSVGNLMGAQYVKINGKKYIFFIPWLASIGDGCFRSGIKKINGHKYRVLTYTITALPGWKVYGTYYPSKSLAKQMKK